MSYELGTNLKLPHSQSGLVLYLPFDEKTGSIAFDLSISKNNAILYTGDSSCSKFPSYSCPIFVKGKVNNAILLTRLYMNWLAASNSPYIDKNLSYTFLAWIKTNTTAEQVIFQNSKANDNRNGASIYNNIFRFGYYDGGWRAVGNSTLSNTFNFVVGINNNGNLSAYINDQGPIRNSQSLYVHNLTNFLYIGKTSLDGEPRYFDGVIDEFRIYNRALSEKEVKIIYEATK